MNQPMIVLFTDFGVNAPYMGQMKAAIYRRNRAACVIDLFADAPRFNPLAAGCLLAAYAREFDPGTIFVVVVDPGVGSDSRLPIVACVDGCHFVGPDNGLFAALVAQAGQGTKREILWRPGELSATFHGRDIFAPVAAMLVSGVLPADALGPVTSFVVDAASADLAQIIYVDSFGNAMTGLRAAAFSDKVNLRVNGHRLSHARTFSDVALGQGFWYANANGLVEIAINCGSAAESLSLELGMPVNMMVSD